jgi:predicted XRE-type DNA-binding protein
MQRVDPIPQLKRETASALAERIAHRSAHDVAVLLGTDAQRVMEIRRGKLDRFSLETLIRYVTRLGQHVSLTITP